LHSIWRAGKRSIEVITIDACCASVLSKLVHRKLNDGS
jgi:hypothetical protein